MSFMVSYSGVVLNPISYTLYTVVQLVTRVEMLSGGRLLALADEGGGISVADLRMLGASAQGVVLSTHHVLTRLLFYCNG